MLVPSLLPMRLAAKLTANRSDSVERCRRTATSRLPMATHERACLV